MAKLEMRYLTPRDFIRWVEQKYDMYTIGLAVQDPTSSDYKYGEFLESVASPLVEDGWKIVYMDWMRAITVLKRIGGQ